MLTPFQFHFFLTATPHKYPHKNNHFYEHPTSLLQNARISLPPIGPTDDLQQIITMRIIATLLLVLPTLSTTTLTSSNCPNSFDVTVYNNSLTYTNQDLAKTIYGGILSAQLQSQIQTAIINGDIYNIRDEFTSTSFLLPYILLAAAFWIFFLAVVCCSLFERRCPPCKSWRRNYVKNPYSSCQRRTLMIFAVIFGAGIVICTIVVFSSFTTLKTDVEMVKCGLYYSIDVATNGEQTKNWGGFGQVQSQLSSISGLVDSTATTVSSSLSGNQWIVDGFVSMENSNLDLYANNQGSEVYTPDPVATNAALTGGTPLPKIVPRFIAQGLGPNGTANTMTTDIDTGLNTTKQLTNQAQATFRSGMNFVSSSANITTNTNTNLQSITQASQLLAKINAAIDVFTQSYLNYVLNYGIYIMQGIFGVILLASLMLLLGVISSHIFDLFTCKTMVNGGWCLLGLIYVGIVAIMISFMVVGGVSHVFCNYFQGVISSQTSFVDYSLKSQANAVNHFFKYLDVCFFNDGNILQKFYVAEQMRTVEDLFTNTQTFLDMQTVGNTNYVDIAVLGSKILGWMNTMTNYGNGIYIDADPADTTQANPYVALANMNLLTLKYNSTTTKNICANDLWVFDSTNCSNSPTESTYTPSADNTNGLYFPPTGSLCISLNTRISNSAPSIWTASDIGTRYVSYRSCDNTSGGNSTQTFNNIMKYATSLTNYRDSRINLYQSLYDELNNLLVLNAAYTSNMSTFNSEVNTFFSSVATLNNLVTNQINGLTISSDCRVIADSFRFFYNMYCVNLMNRSVKIVICCIALLILVVVAVLIGGFFGVVFQRIGKEVRLTKVDELQSQEFRQDESIVSQEDDRSNQSSQRN